jgi:hypothetical protein
MSGPQQRVSGIGDRWLAGEPVAGVMFTPRQRVELARGPRAGEQGTILLLVAMRPEALYHVRADAGDELHVRQSALRAIDDAR